MSQIYAKFQVITTAIRTLQGINKSVLWRVHSYLITMNSHWPETMGDGIDQYMLVSRAGHRVQYTSMWSECPL